MNLLPFRYKNFFITKFIPVISIIIMLSVVTACEQQKENQAKAPCPYGRTVNPSSQRTSPPQPMSSEMSKKMVVTSVLNAKQYSYIEGEDNGVRTWIATNLLKVNPGDTIQYQAGQTMTNFYSKSLNKTFDEIIFTGSVTVMNQGATVMSDPSGSQVSNITSRCPSQSTTSTQLENPHKTGLPPVQPSVANISVPKVEGGYTVEELYAKKKELNGQTVKVRGKVVKFFEGIMKKNWIHLQDGSGSKGTNDLTITTLALTRKGDTIVCTGKLIADKDFGHGYVYALIMEDASITTK